VLVADLDLAMIDEVRTMWQFNRDRRPEIYRELTELLL
jgi:N-carbamoylputrescine amidase